MPSITTYIYRWAAIALLSATGAAGAGQLPADLGGKLAQGYIAPAMLRFQHSAEQIQAGLGAWCAVPASSTTDKLKADFAELVRAWRSEDRRGGKEGVSKCRSEWCASQ